MSDLSRRRLMLGGTALGAGALLAACTSNDTGKDDNTGDQTHAQSQTHRCPDRAHRVLLIQMKTVPSYSSARLPGFINSIR